MANGATVAGMDLTKRLSEIVASAEDSRKKALESIRISRMALCSEVTLIESAMAKIKRKPVTVIMTGFCARGIKSTFFCSVNSATAWPACASEEGPSSPSGC